ncbi:MAG: trigger factor [Firmicutes bacterium]|nr:trigger factor [Bacillota bacterium]
MKVDVERLHKTQQALTIEVELEKVNQALDKAYRTVVKKINVPGFRKGKVPRPILEAQYGRQVLYEDAIETMISESYPEALKEADIEPIDEPKFDIVEMEKDKPFIYKAVVVVKPEIELAEYKGIEVENPEVPEVTDEDVEKILLQHQQRMARLAEASGPAQNGDLLQIDFTGYIDGVPFPGGEASDYSLELGSNTFIPGFEEQLIGAEVGEEKEVNTKFPDDYHAEDLAGKDVQFKVNVKSIRRKEVDQIDDEFAKDVSEFETLAELKADIAGRMKEQREMESKRNLKDKLSEKLAEMHEVEAPEPMVRTRLQEMVQQLSQSLSIQGLSIERYLEATGKKPEDLVADLKPSAEKWVNQVLVLEAIAKQEGIEVSAEEMQAEVEKFKDLYNFTQENVEKSLEELGKDRLKRDILLEKTLEFLLGEAKLVPPAEAPVE